MVTSNFNLPKLITFSRTKMPVRFGTCAPNHLRPVSTSNTLDTVSTVGCTELGFVKWAVGCIRHCFTGRNAARGRGTVVAWTSISNHSDGAARMRLWRTWSALSLKHPPSLPVLCIINLDARVYCVLVWRDGVASATLGSIILKSRRPEYFKWAHPPITVSGITEGIKYYTLLIVP